MQEFGNRLYELRKKSGLSQENLAEKLNISRQTLSKWELGESTPDMEKLIAISDLFEISLDELMLGKKPPTGVSDKNVASVLEEKVFTDNNKHKAKKLGKILFVIFGVLLAADILSLIIYLMLNGGFPK